MRLFAIAACDLQGGIGYKGRLPWDIPEEKEFFREQTFNQAMIMGYRTYLGIPQVLLKNRTSIVLTKKDVKSFSSNLYYVQNEALCRQLVEKIGSSKVFVIGGGEIFEMFFSQRIVCELFLSWVQGVYKSDTFFPLHYLGNVLHKKFLFARKKFKVFRYIFPEVNA